MIGDGVAGKEFGDIEGGSVRFIGGNKRREQQ
jgi:hypothetical protein